MGPFPGESFRAEVGATYALKWSYIDGYIRPQEVYGDKDALLGGEQGLYKFKLGVGYVGKAFLLKDTLFLVDAREAKGFLRENPLSEIRSMVWAPFGNDIVEFGFSEVLQKLPGLFAMRSIVTTADIDSRASITRKLKILDADGVDSRIFDTQVILPEHEPRLKVVTGAAYAAQWIPHKVNPPLHPDRIVPLPIQMGRVFGSKQLLSDLKTTSWADELNSQKEKSIVYKSLKARKLHFQLDTTAHDFVDSRKAVWLENGIQSVVFVPLAGKTTLELGYVRRLVELPAECRVGVRDAAETRMSLRSTIPNIGKILHDVTAIHNVAGFCPDEGGRKPLQLDEKTGDNWIPRNEWTNRLTGNHPFNMEAPPSLLRKHGFVTPNTLHYVRNHGTVPRLSWDTHRVRIGGLVSKPKNFSMQELVTIFKDDVVTLPVTLNCAGNRRKEQNIIQKSIGFDWGLCAASTAVWTGIPLRTILEHCGVDSKAGEWVNFNGPPDELPNGDGTYGASHLLSRILDPSRQVLLAFMMNGELLHPDHGYPLRLLFPGYIGGRMIKWLTNIEVAATEGRNWYHIYDNRVFPKHITSRDVATEEKIWHDTNYAINDRNINSAIWAPTHCEKLDLNKASTYKLEGYAYAGAGRPITRVECTFNGGRNWRTAEFTSHEPALKFGQRFCWVLWTLEVPVEVLANCGEFSCRAWDDSQNTQPERHNWNLMGMMNNPWFRVKVAKISSESTSWIWFEHPTRVESKLNRSWNVSHPKESAPMHTIEKEGEEVLASAGWMSRQKAEVQKVYGPHRKDDEQLNSAEGWELGVRHILTGKIEAW